MSLRNSPAFSCFQSRHHLSHFCLIDCDGSFRLWLWPFDNKYTMDQYLIIGEWPARKDTLICDRKILSLPSGYSCESIRSVLRQRYHAISVKLARLDLLNRHRAHLFLAANLHRNDQISQWCRTIPGSPCNMRYRFSQDFVVPLAQPFH